MITLRKTNVLVLAFVCLVIFAMAWFYLFASHAGAPTTTSWSSSSGSVAEITAKGGGGKASVTDGQFTLTITAYDEGTFCNYKGFWSDGSQQGSFNPYPCDEDGWQAFLDMLEKTRSIGDEWIKALRGVKFW